MRQTAALQTATPFQKASARKKRMNTGWSPERRAAQAARIRIWAPWAKSTGPRTAKGKARSAKNAAKPCFKHSPDAVMKRALHAHSRYLTEINLYIRMRKISGKNELLKRRAYNLRRRLLRSGKNVNRGLLCALAYAKLCAKLSSTAFQGVPPRSESQYKEETLRKGGHYAAIS